MEPESELTLRRQVCFALYSASRAVIGLYRPLLDEVGLTYPQYLVLLVLWERGEASVKGLGAELQLDSSTLSPLVKRLEAAGLVTRRRSAADERCVLVAPTARGRELRGRAGEVWARVAGATGIDPAELAELRDTLTRLAASVGRAGPADPAPGAGGDHPAAPTPGAADPER